MLYFFVRAGNAIYAIATLAIFTRLLSPQEYGVFALGMAIATMASAVLYQWLNVAVGRFYQMYRDNPGIVMAAAARGFWVATTVGAIFFLGALQFHNMIGVEPILLGILFLITVAQGQYGLFLQVANAQRSPLLYGSLSWVKSGVALLIGLALISYGLGERGALIGFLVGLVFALVIFKPMCGLAVASAEVDKHLSAEMFRYGLPLTLTFLAFVVVDLADRFIIGWLLGASAVGPYAAVYDLVQQLIGAIMSVLFLAAFPLVVHALEAEGDEPARVRLRALGRGLVCIGLPAAVGLGILSSDIAEVIFGVGYRLDAVSIMPWLAAAIFVGAFKSYFLDVVFQLRHATKYQGYIATIMATVNVLLNILLLPTYGVIAAAWATFAAFSVGALASWHVGKGVFSLPSLGNDLLGSAISSTVMAITIYSLPPLYGIIWLFVKISLGIIIYLAMAWLLNVASCRSLFHAVIRWNIK
ncbi:MAG: oligosaccharide flippase family protein [Pseudomonadota bacterium]|nr:oligosaccharide flippase family protein [Pseudomonadota bacterium]